MSKETYAYLNGGNILIGCTDERIAPPWWNDERLQSGESIFYPQGVPVEDVQRRLFFWNAQEAPIFVGIKDDDGNIVRYEEQTDRKAIVRSDSNLVLGLYKDSYAIHQYSQWLIDIVADVFDQSKSELVIGSAGVLRNGGASWVSFERPETIQTKEGFPIRPHILATTSHNGSIATTYKAICTAVVCDNTLFASLNETGVEHKTRHSKNSTARVQSIRDALGIIHAIEENYIEEIERLSQIEVSDKEWNLIVDRIVPISVEGDARPQTIARAENKQEAIKHLYKSDPRVAPWSGTALGVLQAFNTWQHHVTGKQESRPERNAFNAITGKTSEHDKFVLQVVNEVVMA